MAQVQNPLRLNSALFDRFSICEAFWVFAAECHGGQFTDVYKIFGRLHNMQFRLGAGAHGSWEALDDDGKEHYYNAWLHFYPGQPVPDDVEEWLRNTYAAEYLRQCHTAGVIRQAVPLHSWDEPAIPN
jgi:hypothetical protein